MSTDPTNHKTQAQEYVRSWQVQILAWLGLALIVTGLSVSTHRLWFLCGGSVLCFVAMLPVLRAISYNRNLDFNNQSDKRFVKFVVVFITAVLIGAVLCVLYARH